MATEIEEALHAECNRLAREVLTLRTEGREEFHRILADITGQLDEVRTEVATFTRDNEALRAALDTATRKAALMSNVCWSLGHEDRDVGPRGPLAKLAKDWDVFRSTIGHLLAPTPGSETPE